MKNYEISEKIVRGLIAYLQTKPYKEVAAGIVALSQLKEITNEKVKVKEKQTVNGEDKK